MKHVSVQAYAEGLIQLYAARGDGGRAMAMSRYMKDRFVFFGIPAPLRKELQLTYGRETGIPFAGDLEDLVYVLWEYPGRELQYTVQEVLSRLASSRGPEMADLYEWMVTHGSWWDTVDFIAARLVGDLFGKYPDLIPTTVPRWMNSGNPWLQRTCLLFQLKYRSRTDFDLLCGLVETLGQSGGFFIQKAIGWSLREYGKTDPGRVRSFCQTTPLSPLASREALRIIQKPGP